MRVLPLVALAAACASPGTPPGGPPDKGAPTILRVSPDSGATNVKAKGITVTFSEVVSERPKTGADLGAIMLLSPSDGAARVEWHREEVSIRPRKTLRPNTAYALTILPGLMDLRGNAVTRARTFVFSTGGSIPHGVVRGAVFDWTTVKPAGQALIEATAGGDTTFKWIARADSLGWYTLPLLPPGAYLLRTIIDANNNGRLEPRELWDSVTVQVSDSVRHNLYAFGHDTLGARIVGVDIKDSLTVRLIFDRPLALRPQLTPDQVELTRADSSRIRLTSLVRAADFDSLARARDAASKDSALRADTSAAGRTARARADTARVLAQRDSIEKARVEARRVARDTVKRVPPPIADRPLITPEFVAVLAEPMAPGTYRVKVRDAVSASGVTRTSERSLTRTKPVEKKPDAAADSTGKKPAVAPGASAKPAPPTVKPATPPAAPPATKPPAR